MTATTIHGILTIIGGVVAFAIHGVTTGEWFNALSLATLSAAVTAGIGLINAKTGSPTT